ncbi:MULTISPECIES: hypothetical protein [unclassified Pseudomonas]|nr:MULTISPECIES: hypothetical protein [unclassified Pseudomonas]
MSTSDTQPGDTQAASTEPEAPVQVDEKELLLQRRLARIEEALGLSPLT